MFIKHGAILILVCLHIASVLLFLSGFLSISISDIPLVRESSRGPSLTHGIQDSEIGSVQPSDVSRSPEAVQYASKSFVKEREIAEPCLDKLVLILIDALRADFIFDAKPGEGMGFVAHQLENGKALGFIAKAQTPTVTLPRIKALITGAVPSFSDVIVNFGARPLTTDNIIRQLAITDRRVVFYGDDTWMKLFPGVFIRSEGVSSFFVSDYTEVDKNVTRNVEAELLRLDWDVMILHYLGLDHIGHIAGPHSSLIAPKMHEMDAVVRKVYRFMENQPGKGLVVLLGDHGMTDAGSHGGSSQAETETAMVFLSPVFQNQARAPPPSVKFVKQVDLSSTISLLMGVAIPNENTGSFVLPVLEQFLSLADIQIAMCGLYSTLFKRNLFDKSEKYRQQVELCRSSVSTTNVTKLAGLFSEGMRNESKSYHLTLMVVSLIILLITVVCHFSAVFSAKIVENQSGSRLMMGLFVFHCMSFLSSSFIEEEHQMWYYWVSTIYVVLAIRSVSRNGKNVIANVLGVLLMQRVLREWNRTGDKWARLPDIGDWLREPTNIVVLNVVIGVSLAVQAVFCRKDYTLLAIPGILAAGFFHVYRYDWAAWMVYTQFVVIGMIWKRCRTTNADVLQMGFLGLASLLVRPHNVFVVTSLLIKERLLRSVVGYLNCSEILIFAIYLTEGWCSLFLLGNSNSISTIDVSAGFVGINFYFAPLHGLLILLHTYIGPLFWLLSFYCHFMHGRLKSDLNLKRITHFGLGVRSLFLLMTFLSCTLQRYHLFVWTVFAPKVLYESVHGVLFCTLICFSLFL